MHAKDRTLLASLGFADRDKRDGRHDLACQYLIDPDVSSRLCGQFVNKDVWSEEFSRECPRNADSHVKRDCRAALGQVTRRMTEVPLSKGSGQYKSVIGFMDVLYLFTLDVHINEFTRDVIDGKASGQWKLPPTTKNRTDRSELLVEVKITPVGAGEIIRQINLYREFIESLSWTTWAVVTAFRPSDSDLIQLSNAKIAHVHLSEEYLNYRPCLTSQARSRLLTI